MGTTNTFAANSFAPGNNDLQTLNGWFKEKYADKPGYLIPDMVKLTNKVPFVSKEKMGGNMFHMPLLLGLEHGVTFASSEDDAFALKQAVSGVTQDAQVRGNPIVLRSNLGYTAASRAMGSESAFMDATKFIVANMLRSLAKKLEIEMFYGQMGYGIIESIGTEAAGVYSAGVAGNVIKISAAEWAPGIWAGAEKMPIEIRSANGSTSYGEFVVTAVNFDNKTVTLNATSAVDFAAFVVWHSGAYGNSFAGIHKILTNTGVLFNIDASKYNLFKGNQYPAGSAALSFTKLNLATARAVEKGLDSNLVAFVNPKAWANMLNDQAALRKYDGSYSSSKLENGSKAILFHSQNGDIEIIPSIYVKEGYAYLLSISDFVRVGSSDVTFKRPGYGEQFFRDLSDNAGYELRLWSDQALFCSAPGKSVLIKDIVNSN